MTRLSPDTGTFKSRFCQPLDWTKGNLDSSTYLAFCKFAGHVLNHHSGETGSVLREVARLIKRTGDSVKTGKLIDQFGAAFAFVAEQRAAESLGALELISTKSKWPKPEPEQIESTGKDFGEYTLAWWESISPEQASKPQDVLPSFFLPKSLVCYGPKQDVHHIRELGERLYEVACRMQYVVPNPAKARFIIRPDGTQSRKCKENFPDRRFLIIEFDHTKFDPQGKLSQRESLDLQAAFQAYLTTECAPLALLVYSGSQSLHGWYPCAGVDESKVLALLRHACPLGVDYSFQTPCQFTRMPGGKHENGQRQTIHYFDPQVLL